MILQSLYDYYGRMNARGEVDPFGFTRENVSFVVVISVRGEIVDVVDLRRIDKGKPRPVKLAVPQPNRTSNIQSNFLWDKTAYAFGVDSGRSKRLSEEHTAFKRLHHELLARVQDERAIALLRFIDSWTPDRFAAPLFEAEMLDHSFVFRLEDERSYIHEAEPLRQVWLSHFSANPGKDIFCLVSGQTGPLEAGHPVLKGVQGAQTSGAYLVSFNAPAFTSYGAIDGANAPTSEAAAFRYGAALNRMLDRGSRNRLQHGIGDATVAFWADTSDAVDESAAEAAEAAFVLFADPPDRTDKDEDQQEAVKISDALEKVAAGRPVEELDLGLRSGTRFHVLGLAPNAARLSVRYWLDDKFEVFARRLAEHHRDLMIEPRPRGWKAKPPSISRLLVKTTALQEKFDNIPPLVAGEVTRAVLTGAGYPRTLLTAAIMRLRAGDDPGSGWHAAVIKACINRFAQHEKEKLPVARDADYEGANDIQTAAYHLGRLFAVLESAQYAALGRVNAPIGDRYYGAASSTPARVFGPLLRGLKNHVSDARKRGRGGWIEPKVAEIVAKLPPQLPRSLRLEDQGRFAIGYYHERATRPEKADQPDEIEAGEQE